MHGWRGRIGGPRSITSSGIPAGELIKLLSPPARPASCPIDPTVHDYSVSPNLFVRRVDRPPRDLPPGFRSSSMHLLGLNSRSNERSIDHLASLPLQKDTRAARMCMHACMPAMHACTCAGACSAARRTARRAPGPALPCRRTEVGRWTAKSLADVHPLSPVPPRATGSASSIVVIARCGARLFHRRRLRRFGSLARSH